MHRIINLNLLDNNFSHIESTVPGKIYKNINFIRNNFINNLPFIYTDNFIFTAGNVPVEQSFVWILEPYDLIPNVYNYVKNNHFRFKNVFNSNIEFISQIPNGIYVPFGGSWIKQPKIYNKNKKISMIFSNKNYLPGHSFRHQIYKRFKNYDIDFFGSAVKTIKDKEEALCDYMFSIVVENCLYNGFFTEKLIDCFSTGTIPIYYGAPDIKKYFNTESIIEFCNLEQLEEILKSVDEKTYNHKINCVYENFNKSIIYEFQEKFIYDFFIKEETR